MHKELNSLYADDRAKFQTTSYMGSRDQQRKYWQQSKLKTNSAYK